MRLRIPDWLDHLRVLAPPQHVVVVGAGKGDGRWVQWLLEHDVPDVTLVEGDDAAFTALQTATATRASWLPRRQVVAPKSGTVPFYTASVATESGLVHPEALQALWPNLATRNEQPRVAVPLGDMFGSSESICTNWLVIDCWPAWPLLNSLDHASLQSLDVVVLRTWLGADAPATLGQDEWMDTVHSFGFKHLETESERNPTSGHVLLWRERRGAPSEARAMGETLEQHADELATRLLASGRTIHDLDAQLRWHKDALVAARSDVSQLASRLQGRESQDAEQLFEMVRTRTATDNRLEALLAELQSQQLSKEHAQQLLEAGRQMLDTHARQVTTQHEDQAAALLELAHAKTNDAERMNGLEGQIRDLGAQLTAIREMLAGAMASLQEQSMEAETRLRTDMHKGLFNAVRQVEAFVGIQNFLATGESLINFHGWPISPDLGLFLLERLQSCSYDLIIEFGSGSSTLLFAKALAVQARTRGEPVGWMNHPLAKRVVTFEHDRNYHESTLRLLNVHGAATDVDLVHAPLVDWHDESGDYLFYDCDAVLQKLALELGAEQARILVLVDGPPGATCTNSRYPALPHVFNRLARHRIDLVLDDANRPGEQAVIKLWRQLWKNRGVRIEESILTSEKGIYLARS